MKGKASCPMCRGSMCFKGFTKLRRYWYQDKRDQVYLDVVEELFEQYNEEYKDVIGLFLRVIQNRYQYIKLNYPNVACEVLEPLIRVIWIDVDYLMNNSNEIFYEPFTFEKYLMVSDYEKKYYCIIYGHQTRSFPIYDGDSFGIIYDDHEYVISNKCWYRVVSQ
jgi:hypothetical protein